MISSSSATIALGHRRSKVRDWNPLLSDNALDTLDTLPGEVEGALGVYF